MIEFETTVIVHIIFVIYRGMLLALSIAINNCIHSVSENIFTQKTLTALSHKEFACIRTIAMNILGNMYKFETILRCL